MKIPKSDLEEVVENNANSFTVAFTGGAEFQSIAAVYLGVGGVGWDVCLSGAEMCAGVTKWQHVAGFTWQKP